jgi:hypothetical protein
MTALLTFIGIVLTLYNKNVRMIPVGETYLVDLAIWAAMGAGALYFRAKE